MKLLPAIVAFVVSFFAFSFLFLDAPVIPDGDSYFHLAASREYAQHGYPEQLRWTRASILGQHFGDKDFLFHVLLVPFAAGDDPATAGRFALALLNASVAAAMTASATAALGWWSLAVPLWLYLAAPMFVFRVLRLRPEVLALLLLLALIHLAAARRYVGFAVFAAVFALSYTAFHVVPGLVVLWLAVTRERDWKLLVAAVGGVAAGLVVHPGFPWNLKIWWIVNVQLFFLQRSHLDVGTEYIPPSISALLLDNLGWWIGIALLFFLASERASDRRPFLLAGVAAIVFGVLTLLMQRMTIYLAAFATLAMLLRLANPLPPRRAAIIGGALLLTIPLSLLGTLATYRGVYGDPRMEAEYAEFGKAVLPGSAVAAHWGPTEFYTFFAPQGRYLNVLDPIFMYVRVPEVYEAQRRVFDGSEPDVPRVVAYVLRSNFIAFPSTSPLFERLQFDPRFSMIHNGYSVLGRIHADADSRFVRDWNESPARNAYVDARRVSGARCVQFTRDETIAGAAMRIYELSSYGPAELTIDRAVRVRSRPSGAMLGRGTLFRIPLAAGTHRFVVNTCAGASGANGFYLLAR